MSRHRSPAGRNAHHGPAPERVVAPGARPRPAPHPGAAPSPDGRRPGAAPAAPAGLPAAVLSPAAWESQHALHVPPADRTGPRVRGRERARHAAAPAVRNGLAGAAATGAALAVVVPVVGALPGAAAADTEVLALAAADITAPSLSAPVAEVGPVLLASIGPVLDEGTELPAGLDAAALLKSVGLADAARAEAEARAAQEARAQCDADLDGLGRVRPHVRDAARFLSCLYDEPPLIGVAGRARVSDHPRGLAVDLMTRGGTGDRIADCVLENRDALGVEYVIWEQRMNYGDGWERMEGRGSDTENHMDHVHVSFGDSGGSGDPLAAACS